MTYSDRNGLRYLPCWCIFWSALWWIKLELFLALLWDIAWDHNVHVCSLRDAFPSLSCCWSNRTMWELISINSCQLKLMKRFSYLSLTLALISPWHISLRNGRDKGRSTSRLSCKVFAKNIPRKRKSFATFSVSLDSLIKGAGKSPRVRMI